MPHYAFSLSKKDRLRAKQQAEMQLHQLEKHNFIIDYRVNPPELTLKSIPNLDYDGDGVPNHYDRCYTVAGIPERDGCPDIDMTKIITVVSPTILFTDEEFSDAVQAFANLDFNKHILLLSSYAALDKFVELLKSNKTWTVCMSSYVDEVIGDKAGNADLSKKRLEAVQKYLIKKGIDKKRISGKYFGDSMPVIDLPPTRFEVELDIDTVKHKTKAKNTKKRK